MDEHLAVKRESRAAYLARLVGCPIYGWKDEGARDRKEIKVSDCEVRSAFGCQETSVIQRSKRFFLIMFLILLL